MVPRSAPAMTMPGRGRCRAAEARKSSRSRFACDEPDSRVGGVVDVEVGHGVSSGLELRTEIPRGTRRLDDERRLRARRSGNCSRR